MNFIVGDILFFHANIVEILVTIREKICKRQKIFDETSY